MLNFGHTIGHAIEALSLNSASPLTHGEAVAIGMYAEGFISNRIGLLGDTQLLKLVEGLHAVGLPTRLSHHIEHSAILECMSLDKKNVGGKARWTLLREIGSATFDNEVASEVVDDAINQIQTRDY
jgi:3-dehydroquinate synthase